MAHNLRSKLLSESPKYHLMANWIDEPMNEIVEFRNRIPIKQLNKLRFPQSSRLPKMNTFMHVAHILPRTARTQFIVCTASSCPTKAGMNRNKITLTCIISQLNGRCIILWLYTLWIVNRTGTINHLNWIKPKRCIDDGRMRLRRRNL